MPAATPDPIGLDEALAELTGALADDRLRLDVVALTPRHSDPERRLSRAEATVLVSAAEPGHGAAVADALLRLQVPGDRRLAAVAGEQLWLALGRPPQPAFLIAVDLQQPVPQAEPQLVLHPLEAHLVPDPASVRTDASRRP